MINWRTFLFFVGFRNQLMSNYIYNWIRFCLWSRQIAFTFNTTFARYITSLIFDSILCVVACICGIWIRWNCWTSSMCSILFLSDLYSYCPFFLELLEDTNLFTTIQVTELSEEGTWRNGLRVRVLHKYAVCSSLSFLTFFFQCYYNIIEVAGHQVLIRPYTYMEHHYS